MEKESLGKRLQNLRCEKGLTQLQLANALNIDKSTVAKYEIDKIEPSLSMFKILV